MRLGTPVALAVLLATLAGGPGCIGVSANVALHYPPRIAPATSAPRRAARPLASAWIRRVDDERHPHRRGRIGEVRNPLGFHLYYLEAEDSLEDWLRTGIEVELVRAGFLLREAQGPPAVELDLRLRRLFAPRQSHQTASLELDALLHCSCHGKVLLAQTYASDVSLQGEADDGAAEALARALQRVAHELAAAAILHTDCGVPHQR